VEKGQNVLIHDKLSRSKSPAVLVGYLMTRYNMELVKSVELLLGCTFKISDHLIGELILLGDAKKDLDLSSRELEDPVDEKEVEYTDFVEEELLALMKARDFKQIKQIGQSYEPYLVRELVWNHGAELVEPFEAKRLKKFCESIDELSKNFEADLFACFQSAMVLSHPAKKMGKELAEYLDRHLEEYERVNVVMEFFMCDQPFSEAFLELCRTRYLNYYLNNQEVEEVEAEVVGLFAKSSLLFKLGKALNYMLQEVRNARQLDEKSQILYLNEFRWISEGKPDQVCNLPESLAELYEKIEKPSSKTMRLGADLGQVEIVHHISDKDKVTIKMPTDVFSVLDCFNSADKLTKDEIFKLCAATRLDAILNVLVRPIPRTDSPLMVVKDGYYEINEGFTSKLRKLEIKIF
jgi:hypothetical protein